MDSPVPRESPDSPERLSENWILLRPGNYGAGVLEGLRVGHGRQVRCRLVEVETAGRDLQGRREHSKQRRQETRNTLWG